MIPRQNSEYNSDFDVSIWDICFLKTLLKAAIENHHSLYIFEKEMGK